MIGMKGEMATVIFANGNLLEVKAPGNLFLEFNDRHVPTDIPYICQ